MKGTAFAMLLFAGMAMPALAADQTSSRQVQRDNQIQTLVTAQLQKKDVYKTVTASVDEGIVTVSGQVPLYIDKVNAERQVRKIKSVDGVRNRIEVRGAVISDSELRESLANKLRYDRVGYGILFNNLAVSVDHGVVAIGGTVRDYPDRDSALAIIATTAGVKDVVDELSVAPVSLADDSLRIRLARAIYGNTSLQKYALDPQAPIRIVVVNGHVELDGMVLNDSDRQQAFMTASSVPGVFSVTNHLAVAAQISE